MKKLSLFVVLICFFVNGFSQELKRNEVDKFTKSKIIETELEVLAMKFVRALRYKFASVNGNPVVVFRITEGSVFSIHDDDIAYLLLDNGESIKLRCISGGVANYDIVSNVSYWWADFTYELPTDIIPQLTSHLVTGIRFDMGKSYTVFDKIKKPKAERFIETMVLMLKNND